MEQLRHLALRIRKMRVKKIGPILYIRVPNKLCIESHAKINDQ